MTGNMHLVREKLLGGSLIDSFMAQVDAVPTAPAVHTPDGTVTYSELAHAAFGLSERIADRLGVGSEPVLLLMGQGVRAITSMLAVLSAGKFYIPVDPDGPIEQLRDVLASTRPQLILTEPGYADLAKSLGEIDVLVMDRFDVASAPRPFVDKLRPDSTAYVYFTSGSTGTPKGVVDTHQNVLHNIFRYTSTLDFNASDCMSLVQTPSISGVVSTQFGALCNGASLCPAGLSQITADKIVTFLAHHGVTVFHAVPAIFRFLTEYGLGTSESLRLIRLEGDRAVSGDVDLMRREYASDLVLVNGLGSTECGLTSQFFVSPGDDVVPGPLPVGYSVPEVEVEVLGPDGDPVPASSEGEVVVRSAYLAKGYWRNAELSSARFRRDADGETAYHTGDIGRLASDGCLELIGRVDDLVKVQGSPLYLGTIEAIILAQPEVADAVVFIEDGSTRVRLVANVVCEPGESPDPVRIRKAILDRLPPAALPLIRQVEKLPTTAAGKLDRRHQ